MRFTTNVNNFGAVTTINRLAIEMVDPTLGHPGPCGVALEMWLKSSIIPTLLRLRNQSCAPISSDLADLGTSGGDVNVHFPSAPTRQSYYGLMAK